jgi:hypothetical protein
MMWLWRAAAATRARTVLYVAQKAASLLTRAPSGDCQQERVMGKSQDKPSKEKKKPKADKDKVKQPSAYKAAQLSAKKG